MASGLGRANLEFVASLVAPLFWVISDPDGRYRVRNGTAFFLDAGAGPFAVTAAHVIDGWRDDCRKFQVLALQLGDLPIDFGGQNKLIASDPDIDIATFRIDPACIRSIGKTVLTGIQRQWPPTAPQTGRGIYIAGFPATETLFRSPQEISFGIATGGGVASSVTEIDVLSQIEREHLLPQIGSGVPPENYKFGGISGGPMLTLVEKSDLLSWSLAGIIYQGPNTVSDPNKAIAGLEIMRARRARFLLSNGDLDRRAWNELA
jgi:hypothetical protein